MEERPAKRKKVVLSIEQKLEIIELLKKGTSYTIILEKYGIGRSTVSDIKKNESKLNEFKKKMTDKAVKAVNTKTMKMGSHEKLDVALYIWFRQQRENNIPVSGPFLQEKAKLLFDKLYPDSPKPFSASSGFQWRFGKRHGFKHLSIQGEQVSADVVSACDFQAHFSSMIENYTHNQIFVTKLGFSFACYHRKLWPVYLKSGQKENQRSCDP